MSAPSGAAVRKTYNFACDRCRSGKRKCDAEKPKCGLCARQGKPCVYTTESRPRKRKYWDEDYVRNLEDQVRSLLVALKTSSDGGSGGNVAAVPPAQRIATSYLSSAGVEAEVEQNEESAPWPRDLLPRARHDPSWGCHLDVGGGGAPPDHDADASASARVAAAQQQRSEAAMEELSVMMWRTNIGDGVTIISDDLNQGSEHRVEPGAVSSASSSSSAAASSNSSISTRVHPPPEILARCADRALLRTLARSFLDNINSEHQFTPYTTPAFVDAYPHGQPCDQLFLHSAILASGATFAAASSLPDADAIANDFARFAESLIFTCFRAAPGLAVVRGLCILSERALASGLDHFGWTFISMAAGMSVHLRLHVLALDECAARRWQPSRDEIRTFWMFYMTDRTAISILGRNCVLPWRRVNVPSFEESCSSDTRAADISEVSFAWQCKLWYLHDSHMDQIFSSSFESTPQSQQIQLLVSTHDALRSFFRSKDLRLDLPTTSASTTNDNNDDTDPTAPVSKHVLFFHMAYQMAHLITLPPFLRCFTTTTTTTTVDPEVTTLILRSLTNAAATMVRLVRMYKWDNSTGKPNPVIIHYLLSAAIVHLMNATSAAPPLRRQSARWLRLAMDLLARLRAPWRVRADKSVKVIRVLAQRWGVLGALPVQYSYRVDPLQQQQQPRRDGSTATTTMVDDDDDDGGGVAVVQRGPGHWDPTGHVCATTTTTTTTTTGDGVPPTQPAFSDGWGVVSGSGGGGGDGDGVGVEFAGPDMDVDFLASMGVADGLVNHGTIDLMQEFGSLSSCHDFSWLISNEDPATPGFQYQ